MLIVGLHKVQGFIFFGNSLVNGFVVAYLHFVVINDMLGQAYNSNPTPENNETMKNFDMIVGKLHTGLLRLMMQHSEGEFEVDPAQQRQYLLKEMNESLTEVFQFSDHILNPYR